MKKFSVNLSKEELEEWPSLKNEITGRVVYNFNEICDNELSFYCGPEIYDSYTQKNALLDCSDGGVYKQLEELLSGMEVDIGAAENFHIVMLPDDESFELIWKKIETLLIEAGAVELKLE